MNRLFNVACFTATAFLIAACSTSENQTVPTAKKTAPMMPPYPRQLNFDPGPPDALNNQSSILANRSIYFDFDKYEIKTSYSQLNVAIANYLIFQSPRTIVIEGNTDNRGGREYNLALGQKRAEAERQALVVLGVPISRMEVISFGKEKPKNNEDNEAAWAENRRDDINYSGK